MAAATLEEQLQDRGLELLGHCERLSQSPELLQLSALLRDFTPAEADMLGAGMLRVRAQPGQLLIAEDEASDWMMLLLRGTVDVGKRKVGASSDEQEPGDITRLAVLKQGAALGDVARAMAVQAPTKAAVAIQPKEPEKPAPTKVDQQFQYSLSMPVTVQGDVKDPQRLAQDLMPHMQRMMADAAKQNATKLYDEPHL